MRHFDYSFLEHDALPASFIGKCAKIAELSVMSNVRRKTYAKVFDELEREARRDNILYSCKMGAVTTSDERKNIILEQDAIATSGSELEIIGYRDAYDAIYNERNDINMCEEDIRDFHKLIFSRTTLPQRGIYRTDAAIIKDVENTLRGSGRFTPIAAQEVALSMHDMFLAYKNAENNEQIYKLLIIPCVIMDFLCIHPFAEGNGRESRLMTEALLSRYGYDVTRYISIDKKISSNMEQYIDALYLSSQGWYGEDNSYNHIIDYFLSLILDCYRDLDKRFVDTRGEKLSKQDRITAAVKNSSNPISKKELIELLPDISPTTIEMVLGALVKNGDIIKLGNSRNTKYISKEN